MAWSPDDTSAAALDRLVGVAARALAAPVAVLTLRGGADHRLAAAAGLPREWAGRRGERLDDALPPAVCAAHRAHDAFAVADVRAVPHLRDGALAAAAGAVACAGAALRDADGGEAGSPGAVGGSGEAGSAGVRGGVGGGGKAGAPGAVGALCVLDVRPRAWTAAERALLVELAQLAAHECARARAAHEDAALRRVATAVARGAAPPRVHALVAEAVAGAYGTEGGIVVRYEDDRRARVVGTWAADPARALPVGAALAADEGGIAAAIRAGAPARADGGAGHAPFRHRVGAPVRIDGRVWGFVAALAGGSSPAAGTERRIAAFAELVAAAVGASDERARLAAQTTIDPVTGLPNRRAFDERLAAEARRAERHGRNLALALLALEHVEGADLGADPAGATASGDAILAELARRAAGTVRAGELLARVGAAELALLLPEADAAQAQAAAERIRQLAVHEPATGLEGVAIAAGVGDLAFAGSADGLLRTADDALALARAEGPAALADAPSEAGRPAPRRTLLDLGALARSVDERDPGGAGRRERVAELAVRLARAAGWPPARLALLREAALVHDVGMVAVDERIVARRAPTAAEAARLREHARLGAEIAAQALAPEQVAWIRSHHERPDGRGYPDGLVGDAIPPGARLIALADAWEAMTRPAPDGAGTLSPADALARCRAGAGTRFADEAVAALERMLARSEPAAAWTAAPAVSLGA